MRGVTNEVRQTEGWLWGGRDWGPDRKRSLLFPAEGRLLQSALCTEISEGQAAAMSHLLGSWVRHESCKVSLHSWGGLCLFGFIDIPLCPSDLTWIAHRFSVPSDPTLLLVFGAGWLSSMAFRHCSARALLSPGRSQSLSSYVNVKVCILPELKHCSLPEATGRYFS